jgi:hypothetical protein
MGMILNQHGHITCEARRESFYVHTDYGYEPELFRLGELTLGTEFAYDGTMYKVSLLAEDRVEGRDVQFSSIHTFSPDAMVTRPGFAKDAEGAFAEHWRGPHPEFRLADIDDLVAALDELKGYVEARA